LTKARRFCGLKRRQTPPAEKVGLGAKKKGRKELDLATPVEHLELSKRAKNALTNDGVRTLRDLLPKTEAELLLIPNLGRCSLSEITAALAKRGLRLGMEIQEPDSVPSPPPPTAHR
jgi:DNA-directed RNA polymerase alpha subunit